MDPVTILGAVGSVVGIAAFGLQLSQFVNEFLGQYERANENLHDVCYGLERTIAILDEIEGLLKLEKENRTSKSGKPELFNDKALAEVRKNTDACLKVFWRIEAAILYAKETPKDLEKRIKEQLQEFHDKVQKGEEKGLADRNIIRLSKRRNMNRVQRFVYTFSTGKQLTRYRDQLNFLQQSLSLLLHVVHLGMYLRAPKTPVNNYDVLSTREIIKLTAEKRRQAMDMLSDQDDDFADTMPPPYKTYVSHRRSDGSRRTKPHQDRFGKEEERRHRHKIPNSQDFRPLRRRASSTENDLQRGRTEKRGTYINRTIDKHFKAASASPRRRDEMKIQERSASESIEAHVDYEMKGEVARRHMEGELQKDLKRARKGKRATELDSQLADSSKSYPEIPFSQSPTRMDDDELHSMRPQHDSVVGSPIIERQKQDTSFSRIKTRLEKVPAKYQKPSVTEQLPDEVQEEISDPDEALQNFEKIYQPKPKSPSIEVLPNLTSKSSLLVPPPDDLEKLTPEMEAALLDEPILVLERALLTNVANSQASKTPNGEEKTLNNNHSLTKLIFSPKDVDVTAFSLRTEYKSRRNESAQLENKRKENPGGPVAPHTSAPLGVEVTISPKTSSNSLKSTIVEHPEVGLTRTEELSQKKSEVPIRHVPGAWIDDDESLDPIRSKPTSIAEYSLQEAVEGNKETINWENAEKVAEKGSFEAPKPREGEAKLAVKDPTDYTSPRPSDPRTKPQHVVSSKQVSIIDHTETLQQSENQPRQSPVNEKSQPKIAIHIPLSPQTRGRGMSSPNSTLQSMTARKMAMSPKASSNQSVSESPKTTTPIIDTGFSKKPIRSSLDQTSQQRKDEQLVSKVEGPSQDAKEMDSQHNEENRPPEIRNVPPMATLAQDNAWTENSGSVITTNFEREEQEQDLSAIDQEIGGTVNQSGGLSSPSTVPESLTPQIHVTLSSMDSPEGLSERYTTYSTSVLNNQETPHERDQKIDVFQFLVPEDDIDAPQDSTPMQRTDEKFEETKDTSSLDIETETSSIISSLSTPGREQTRLRGLWRIKTPRDFVTRSDMEELFGRGSFLTAFVIRGKDYHKIPCPGHFSLRQRDLEKSQSSGPISWRRFAFLTTDEMSALSAITSSEENVQLRTSLVHLKRLRKEKLKFWSNENRALVAIIQNQKPGLQKSPQDRLEDDEDSEEAVTSPKLEKSSVLRTTKEMRNPPTRDENIEIFVIYAAFTIRVLEPQNEYGDCASVPPTADREGFSEADILQRITELKVDGPHVIEKKLKLLKTQQTEIAKIVRDMNKDECEPGFVWNVAQLERIDGQATGIRSVTVYFRKRPLGVETIITPELFEAPQHEKASPKPATSETFLPVNTNVYAGPAEVPRNDTPPIILSARIADNSADTTSDPPESTPIMPWNTMKPGTARKAPERRRTPDLRRKSITESSASVSSEWSTLSSSLSSYQPKKRRTEASIYNPYRHNPEIPIRNINTLPTGPHFPNPFDSRNRSLYFQDPQVQYYSSFHPPAPASNWAMPPPIVSANNWAMPPPIVPTTTQPHRVPMNRAPPPPTAPEVAEKRAHFADDTENKKNKPPGVPPSRRNSESTQEQDRRTPQHTQRKFPAQLRTPKDPPSNAYSVSEYEPSQSSRTIFRRQALPGLEPVRKDSRESAPLKRRSKLPYPATFDSRSFRLEPTESEVLQEDTRLVRDLLVEWVPNGDEDDDGGEDEDEDEDGETDGDKETYEI
ncbi:hypothetical protein HYFRA_00000472 [Hymenoscyphus fraxineus]|uniref:Uncharacterized protein n=1 Tax=Hymenoscyphus fraxineus TaxID=746836 RepID=A0A9N9L3W8_9HELO|nr:hypothetical protein HYFRA_00000472 [Hymenoscyphus fraxineus]